MSRSFWLAQLRKLDQPCAPDLPPHIDIDALSCQQLRILVVGTIRSYEQLMKVSPSYVLRATIVLHEPTQDAVEIVPYTNDIKLSPGGQYLFVGMPDSVLRMLDLYHSNVCVWSYEVNNLGSREHDLEGFNFEINKGGSVNVVIVKSSSRIQSFTLEVHQLTHTMYESCRFVSSLACATDYQGDSGLNGDPRINGDYAASPSVDSITVVDWRKGHAIEVTAPESEDHDSVFHGLELWRNYLFYVREIDTAFEGFGYRDEYTLNVVDLRQLLAREIKFTTVSVDDLKGCSLPLVDSASRLIRSIWKPSVCDFAWKGTSSGGIAAITIGVQLLDRQEAEIFHLVYEFTFDSRASDLGNLTLRRVPQPSRHPSLGERFHDSFTTRCGRSPLRRARMHTTAITNSASLNFPGVSVMGVNQDGDVLFSHLPNDFSAPYRTKFDHFYITLEHYSNALICRSLDSGPVDIWYPS